jgi:hypothetical protein
MVVNPLKEKLNVKVDKSRKLPKTLSMNKKRNKPIINWTVDMKNSSPASTIDFFTLWFKSLIAIMYVKARRDSVADTKTNTSMRLIISSKFLIWIAPIIQGIRNPMVNIILRYVDMMDPITL